MCLKGDGPLNSSHRARAQRDDGPISLVISDSARERGRSSGDVNELALKGKKGSGAARRFAG